MPSAAKHPVVPPKHDASFRVTMGVFCAAVVLLGGCAGPNKANIELRRQNQALRDELETLRRQRLADAATITALQRDRPSSAGGLSVERLERLFTVAGLQFGRLTGGYDFDPQKPGDDAIRVQVVPTDVSGQPIKAAGEFVIEAFDLAAGGQRVGRWEYDLEQSRSRWLGSGMLYHYLFIIPLDAPPTTPQLTLNVRFTDELTGREFSVQRPITLRLPGSAQ